MASSKKIGVIRFGKGFPKGFGDFIDAHRTGRRWNLRLEILDDDDGNDDGSVYLREGWYKTEKNGGKGRAKGKRAGTSAMRGTPAPKRSTARIRRSRGARKKTKR